MKFQRSTQNFYLLRTIIFLVAYTVGTNAALRQWSGASTNDSKWTTATNWVVGPPVPGDDLLFPVGASQLFSANDFPAATTFNSLIFSGGGYNLNGSSIALNAGILATNGVENHLNNSLVLNSNQTFTIAIGTSANFYFAGPINLNGTTLTFDVKTSSQAQVNTVISGSGGLIKTGTGTALMYASNTFDGPVQIQQGGMSIYGSNALGNVSGNTTISSGASINLLNPLTVSEPIVLAGNMISGGGGIKNLNGFLSLTAPDATISVSDTAPLTINGLVSGSGGFNKTGIGNLTFNANNTYAGITTVSGGSLNVNGSQPTDPIMLNFGGLGGTGTVGTISVSGGGTLNPGNPIGILNSSNITLNPSTTLNIDLFGTNMGSGYDQLKVKGSVTLSNAQLNLSLGFTPALGTSFKILDNDGTDAVNGIFNNRPEGSLHTNGATIFRISYQGGDGNDVTLTTTLGAPASTLTSMLNLTNGFKQLTGQGISNLTYTIQSATNLNTPVAWTPLGTATADVSGVYRFTDTNTTPAMRFYRVLSP
jgi:autotransporter-associated beta strand protein